MTDVAIASLNDDPATWRMMNFRAVFGGWLVATGVAALLYLAAGVLFAIGVSALISSSLQTHRGLIAGMRCRFRSGRRRGIDYSDFCALRSC